MLDPADFRDAAARLSVGKRTRIDHTCGPGRTLIVSKDAGGASAWCFRCSEGGFIKDRLPLAERIARAAARDDADADAKCLVTMPDGEPDPQAWPRHARLWVYKAGLSNQELMRLGFRYSERMDRVVMPVTDDDGVIVFWQARGFSKDRPKYLAPAVDRTGLAAKYGRGLGNLLVLTEDILSAVKVGRQCEAWCIMGTSLDDTMALAIARDGRRVVIALDPDPAGRRGAGEAFKKLSILGVKAQAAYMQHDPKLHSNKEIEQWLSSIPWRP